ncbi:MAG: IS4 family transposase [Actinobacteria bacterium]|nr:IS4 family transposase [Actinomycetota bacterium]
MAKNPETSRSESGRLTDHVTLGVLSSVIHRDIVDDVIRETGKREERSRLLPAHVVVYYVLALNLFFGDAYEEVMRQLVNGLRFLGNWRDRWTVPTTSAISQARTRLGEAPLKLLFERIAVPMARPGTRGAWFHGLRVMAIDGLVLDVADTPANDEQFGRSGNEQTPGPFPQVRLVAVGECGTHAVVDAELGGVTTGEQTLATALISRFAPGMLVLADRNFYSYQAWQQAAATGAQLLWRVSATLTLPVLQWLPDGSYRSVLINPKIRGRRREALLATAAAGAELDPAQAMLVRVVEYTIEDRPGSSGELFCLITTIADHEFAPAVELAAAYAQRWEIELSFDEIETHQTGHHRVLRSKTPQLVKQEIWSLLLTHYAIRSVMKDAADTVGTDPDDLSFIRSYRAIRRQVTNQAGFSP